MRFLWKTYLIPKINYCSQLWEALPKGLMDRLEELQRAFTAKIPSISHMSYWDRLSELKLSSIERRFERYRAIYTWKVLEGWVPNCGILWTQDPRNGRRCSIPRMARKASDRVQTLRDRSFQVAGPKMFNSLPCSLRNLTGCDKDTWKKELDLFLSRIPDTPNIGDYISANCNSLSARPSNSVLDWAPRLGQDLRRRIVLDTELRDLENDTDSSLNMNVSLQCTMLPLSIEWINCDGDSSDSFNLMTF